MPVPDPDIHRAAHGWIQQHGENATAKARERVEQMRQRGDADGADHWLRIIVAISTVTALSAVQPPGFALTHMA
jgi:hypothetical protein